MSEEIEIVKSEQRSSKIDRPKSVKEVCLRLLSDYLYTLPVNEREKIITCMGKGRMLIVKIFRMKDGTYWVKTVFAINNSDIELFKELITKSHEKMLKSVNHNIRKVVENED